MKALVIFSIVFYFDESISANPCPGNLELKIIHWDRVTHKCVSELTIIGSDNGLSPARREAIIWTNAAILLIGPLGTNFSEILIGIQTFSFQKLHLKTSSAKWRLFCLGLNELNDLSPIITVMVMVLITWQRLCCCHSWMSRTCNHIMKMSTH